MGVSYRPDLIPTQVPRAVKDHYHPFATLLNVSFHAAVTQPSDNNTRRIV